MSVSALSSDFYELTMMQGYYRSKNNPTVVFDMFYRSNPYNGGYVVFAGLHDVLRRIELFTFSEGDIAYLRSLNRFDEDFLEYLADFHFTGRIDSVCEGTVVFPGEPLLRVEATMIEAQLIEGMILNTLNYQSLIATKASRAYRASKGGEIMEFGLRRAQGPDGAFSASRAAFIGGASATSNTLAGKVFDIPVAGTMAHSWVMLFETELESFRVFADIFPDNTILLIDTYDTLGSGIRNAIIVGKELKERGKSMGVRIDSGDLSYLSRKIRTLLDDAGLEDCKIYVSNDLTEEIIETLVRDEAPIDSWGIGTHLVTGGTQSSLNGVYKLAARQLDDHTYLPVMKISNTFEKATNPGKKQVWRFYDEEGIAVADLITLDDEEIENGNDILFYHPFSQADFFTMKKHRYAYAKKLLSCVMEGGKRLSKPKHISEIQQFAKESLATIHDSHKRIINPHIYKVSLSEQVKSLKTQLVIEGRQKMSDQ
ncbi:MAG: nicotinate phosphoribosyltransferase [Sphaerochaetaceae bacterium]|jgi:nicotinate phosphoribosyltransferase